MALLSAMAMLTAVVEVHADSNLPFDEPFEYVDGASLDATNGWSVTGDGSAIATNSRVQLGNATLSNLFAGEQNAVTIRFDLQPKFSEASPSDVIPEDAAYAFFVGTNGLINAYNGATTVELSHDPLNESHAAQVTVRLEYPLQKWSLWVNGAKVATDFDFYAGGSSGFKEVGFFDGSMDRFSWLDTITITAATSSVPPEISFLTDAVEQGRAQTNVAIPVLLYPAQPVTVMVDHAIQSESTAIEGIDYIDYTPGTLTFAPGQTNKFITFKVIEHAEVEPADTMLFSLQYFVNAAPGRHTNFLYAIVDNTNNWYALPFAESFETTGTGDLNNQRGWRAFNARVQSDTAFAGSKAAVLTSREHSISHTFNGDHDNLWTDMRVQPVFGIGRTPPPDSSTAFFVQTNGHVHVYDGSLLRDLTPSAPVLTEGEWTRFTVYSDYTAKRWELYVNGRNATVNGLAFYNASAAGYRELNLLGGLSNKAHPEATYLDEVNIDFARPEGLSNPRAGLVLFMR